MGLRWFRDRTTADALPRDHSDSRATAYRYLDEVILVLAEQAPDLGRMLERAKDEEFSHVILDMSRSLPRRDLTWSVTSIVERSSSSASSRSSASASPRSSASTSTRSSASPTPSARQLALDQL